MQLREHHLQADIVVAGGGAAGVPAALAAARHGAKVVLIQDRSVLGGNSSSEVRMHIVGADRHGHVSHAREGGIIEELRLEDAVWNQQRSNHMWDQLLLDKVVSEPNITLLLNSTVDGVRLAGAGHIAAVHVSRSSMEEALWITAALFLDCTGDGRLGVEAGAEYRMGREGRDEYGEDLAWVTEADHQTLGSSILFTARKHDRAMPFRAPRWARTYRTCEELPFRPHRDFEYGYWWIEWGGQLDTIADNDRIRHELTRITLGVWNHIKNSGWHPESANWALEWVAAIPGKRESRRLVGPHVLTQGDLQAGTVFPDAVAYGGWAIDEHPPEGIDNPGKPFIPTPVPLYSIPLRSLYSRNIDNLFMAGRNISASHVAFASTRVMATCAVIGQAAGTAAALCAQQNLLPAEICGDHLTTLQQTLLRDDAYLLGVHNGDLADHARCAKVTPSSELSGFAAVNILSGVTRQVGEESNAWHSAPLASEPAWLELRWPRPQRLGSVQCVFDTGFTRQLTLTMSDSHNARQVRAAQPETVRDYRIEAEVDGMWQTLAEVRGNYQRRQVHDFAPLAATALRITVTATNGAPEARLF
ncbi:MAG TPA: FAD-dependent oxidoreductase, partial [Chloroflexota bacterium]